MKGEANLLIMPSLDAANISFNLLKVASGDNVTLGPILLGVAKPVHILTPSATVRRMVNMTALTVVDALLIGFAAAPRLRQAVNPATVFWRARSLPPLNTRRTSTEVLSID